MWVTDRLGLRECVEEIFMAKLALIYGMRLLPSMIWER